MNQILEKIGLFGIVPVVVIEDENAAEPLAQSLVDAGLPCAEVTFRTDAAKNVIGRMVKSQSSMLIGAGTVISVDQVKMAVDAGARFIVSPGLNRNVVEYCLNINLPVTPGVVTPTEVGTAIELGLEVVKFFPAEASGGINYLKAISGPFKKIKFIPTGGIDETNLVSYLRHSNVLACGGSWMVKQELVANGRFDEITRLASQAMSLMLGFELRHIGINNDDAKTGEKLAAEISTIFNLQQRESGLSTFVGTHFEVLKRIYLGKHGHIAIGTNFIDRAVAFFEQRGVKILPGTKNEKDGKLHTVYLDLDLGGFAVHLIQL